ncbi:MAG: hypothetical protein E7211_00650 [Clostridium lundense]|nr:hypothetical protein [Clostridium lundense]
MGLVVSIIFFIILYFVVTSTNEKHQQTLEEHGISYEDSTMKYLGGFPTIEGDKKCTLRIKDVYLHLSIEGNSTRVISLSKIKDVRIISKEQLQEKINLGKLIVFGALALAFKDKKLAVNNFMQIQYNNGTEDLTLIFTSDKLETTCRRLRSVINI